MGPDALSSQRNSYQKHCCTILAHLYQGKVLSPLPRAVPGYPWYQPMTLALQPELYQSCSNAVSRLILGVVLGTFIAYQSVAAGTTGLNIAAASYEQRP
eukprot:2684868-Rhodomonas_salina.1